MKVLVLGGTTEAAVLAAALDDRPEVQVVTSLAGRVARPSLPAGEVRIGGFGGADGLAHELRTAAVDVLVDATHPFAAAMRRNAEVAARLAEVPLVVLRRPGWTEQPGDRWHRVADEAAAAALLPALGRRALLALGRGRLEAFAGLDDVWFLLRAVDPPNVGVEGPPGGPAGSHDHLPRHYEVVLGRGPFALEDERALLREHAIDVVVSRDSGGPTSEKLVAARELGLPVVMVDRPPAALSPTVSTVDEALAALDGLDRP